jgi:hypothetical protein
MRLGTDAKDLPHGSRRDQAAMPALRNVVDQHRTEYVPTII